MKGYYSASLLLPNLPQILKGMPIRRQACFSLRQIETNALRWGLVAVGQTLLLIRGEGKRQIK